MENGTFVYKMSREDIEGFRRTRRLPKRDSAASPALHYVNFPRPRSPAKPTLPAIGEAQPPAPRRGLQHPRREPQRSAAQTVRSPDWGCNPPSASHTSLAGHPSSRCRVSALRCSPAVAAEQFLYGNGCNRPSTRRSPASRVP